MTTKKSEPVVVDALRSLRAALDAPARERAAAEAREREAEQRTRQAAALSYARAVRAKLETARTAATAWAAAPVDMTALRATFGESVPVWRASDLVNSGSAPIATAARIAGEVDRLMAELARQGMLPAARLDMILKALDGAAGQAESFRGVYAGWIRMREDAVALLPAIRGLVDALERRWTPTAAERALLASQQQWLADVTAAMPPIPPPAPRRGIPNATFDAETNTSTLSQRPMLENEL